MITTSARHVRDDVGPRLEMVPMDRHCADITISLYATQDGASAIVQSYSGHPDAESRLDWLAAAMRTLGGMMGDADSVRFTCGQWHAAAARRVFLEACKPDPAHPLRVRELTVEDARTSQTITVDPTGAGEYRCTAVAADPSAPSRASAVAAGLAKLAAMTIDPDDETLVRFSCGVSHDELVALLLPRAINVRAALREQELAATRGILVAPSAQQAPGA